jgi:hypothetical protein
MYRKLIDNHAWQPVSFTEDQAITVRVRAPETVAESKRGQNSLPDQLGVDRSWLRVSRRTVIIEAAL